MIQLLMVIVMRNKILLDIKNYINYLNNLKISISIHGDVDFDLLEYNFHKNSYCSLIKLNDQAWNKCICSQSKIYKLKNKESFFGMCYAGVEEYVYFVNDKTFISVSGYGINFEKAKARIKYISDKYGFIEKELLEVYEKELKHENIDKKLLDSLINPLCNMIILLNFFKVETNEMQTSNKLYISILRYIQRNFMNEISINDIAKSCYCSPSSVSHLFKTHTNKSVHDYIIDLRISQSCKFLKYNNFTISQIAELCGFKDSNHFSTVFKKKIGITPSEYKKISQ